jgi:DNA polymerase III subunit beta
MTEPLTIDRDALLKAVQAVGAVVERRNTVPILQNILLEAVGGTLRLRATDLDIDARAEAPADGHIHATVPGGLLQDILRKLAEGSQVKIAPDVDTSERLVLRAGRARFTINTLPPVDFPDMTAGEWAAGFDLPATALEQMLGRCAFAISTEETRYYLNGVYLHAVAVDGATMLTAVATDGHRLARVRREAPDGASGMPGVIIPRKTVEQIRRDLKAAAKDETVRLDVSTLKIRYSSPRITLTSKLIDGTFPDYTRVIPVANDKRLTAELAELLAASDRVSTIASDRGRAVKIELGDGPMKLSVSNPDAGSSVEEIEADYDGAPLTIGFNARYLHDILGEIDSDTVLIKLDSPGSPTILQSREGADALFVLMPMRV